MPRDDFSRSGRSWAEPSVPSTASTGIRGERIAPLDGLRGLAILMVVLTHYGLFIDRQGLLQRILRSIFDYGWTGVDLFFVLSGFLITGILLASRNAGNYFRAFYARRILRIFPLYYFSLVVLFGFLIPTFHSANQNLPKPNEISRYFLYVQNWFMPLQWSGQYWSLAIEEQFYLVWPLVVYHFDRKRVVQIAIGASLFSLVLRSALVIAGRNPILVQTNIFTRLDALLIGAVCACLVRENSFADRFRGYSRWLWLSPFVIFPALRLAAGSFHNTAPVILSAGYTFVGLACAGVLLAAVLTAGSRTLLQRFLTHPTMRMLGKYSYAAYIWHVLVRVVVLYLEESVLHISTPWFVNIPLLFAITVGVSMLSYMVIERPFLSLKRYFEPVIQASAAGQSS